jgi:CDP-diacylglycerol--glycerol-3-phosphate 3-phosphatidyltransferase
MEQTVSIALLSWLIFLIAAGSDWVDGYVARRYKSETVLGKLMDPLADKVLVSTALIMLIPLNRLPAWLVLLILCRELIITGLRGIAASAGIVVAASGLGKLKSIVQYIGLGTLIFPMGLVPFPALHDLGLMIVYLSLGLSIWSGLDYFLKLKDVFLASSQ